MSDYPFNKMLNTKNPEVNVDKMLQIFDERFKEIKKIQGTKVLRLPLDCDLNKALLASIISDYLKE